MNNPTNPFTIRKLAVALAMCAACLLSTQSVHAQASGVWTGGGGDGLWTGDANNWTNGIIATGSGQTADFSQIDLTANTVVHLDSPLTIGSMIFGNTDASPSHSWIVDTNGSAANILTLASGVTPTITVNNLGTGQVDFLAPLAGTQGFIKDGPGTLTLSNANPFTGTITIKRGTLILGPLGSAGPSADPYTLGDPAGGDAALLLNLGGGNLTNVLTCATGAAGNLLIGSSVGKATFQAAINLNGNNLIISNSALSTGTKLLISGAVSGTGNVTCIVNGISGNTSQIQAGTMNNTGTVTLMGNSVNASGFLAFGFGTGVSGINYNTSLTGLPAFTAPANTNGVVINSSSTLPMGVITLPNALSNVTLNANSSGSITIGTVSISFKGFIENSGTGTGPLLLTPGLANDRGFSSIIQNSATSPFIISGSDYYNVPTVVSNGTLLITGPGSTGQTGSPITVYSGGKLGGTGTIGTLVTVQAGGTLAPGTNTPTTVGTLTLFNGGGRNGALSLSGNLFFKLNKTGATLTNDYVAGTTLLTNLGFGTLTLTNIGSTPIANGDKFTLFSGPVIGGNNLTIVYPSGQFVNNLSVDGSITAGNQAPTISNLLPAAGTSSGGSVVTITGTGFSSGVSVTFGSTPGTSINLTGSTNLTVTTPAHAAGLVTVTVMNTDGQFATSSYTFTSVPAPTISSISPTNGPTTGGTSVNISGGNFLSGDTVQFGSSSPVVATFNSSSSLTVTTPTHAGGTVNITVADVNNQTGILTNAFTFVTPIPAIWIAPNGGGDGLWTSDTSNWTNGIVPNGADQTADFSQEDYTGTQALHLDAPVTAGYLIFGTTDTNSAVDWTLDNNGSTNDILTLKTAAGTPTITVTDPQGLGNNAIITSVVAGTNGLVVTGGGMLTLGQSGGLTTNIFTGGITLQNGSLLIKNNADDANTNDVVTLGSTNAGSSTTLYLDGGGIPNPVVLATGAQGTITISGDPVALTHAVLSGPAVNLNGNNLTFVAPAGVVGNSKLANGSTGTGNLTLVQNGTGTILNSGTYANIGSITLQGAGSGTFNLGTFGTGITALNYESSSTPVTTVPPITVTSTGTTINSSSSVNLPLTGGMTIAGGSGTLTLQANSTGNLLINALSFSYAGNIINSGTGTGATTISAGIFNNSGLSNMIQDSATSPLILSGNNYYNVPTLVSNGTLLVDCVLVTGQRGSPITVFNGGTLGGIGSIGNLVTVEPGGTLAPSLNDGVTIGTLTITNGGGFAGALSLAGNLLFKVNNGGGQSNDFVTGTTALTNIGTGTLTVSNIGPTLNPGDTFQLFSSPLIGGSALTIVGPTNFINHLAVDGSIQVSNGAIPIAATGSATVSGSNLNLVWTGGASQTYVLLSSTNAAAPLSTWTPIATNTADGSGLSTNIISIPPGDPQRFFVLAAPY